MTREDIALSRCPLDEVAKIVRFTASKSETVAARGWGEGKESLMGTNFHISNKVTF